MRRAWLPLTGMVVAILITTTAGSARPQRVQALSDRRPAALAPFAADDPIPKVDVKVYDRPRTPQEVAESFLAHLSQGYGVPGLSIIGADPSAYEKAWSLLGPERPSLAEFTERWRGTVAIKVVQFEPAQDNRFFVELEVMERCNEHWSVSFYSGFLKTEQTDAGWRVQAMEISPEDLLGINVAGHQGWQHDAEYMAKWVMSRPPDESWHVESVEYVGRQAVVRLYHPTTRQTRMVRLVRTMEGSWGLLSDYDDR